MSPMVEPTPTVSSAPAVGLIWRILLEGAASDLSVRPEVGVWSAIEYAAHSRDITALHDFGVEQALTVDEIESTSAPASTDMGDPLRTLARAISNGLFTGPSGLAGECEVEYAAGRRDGLDFMPLLQAFQAVP